MFAATTTIKFIASASHHSVAVQSEGGTSRLRGSSHGGIHGLPAGVQASRRHHTIVDVRAYTSMPIISHRQRTSLRRCRSMSSGGVGGSSRAGRAEGEDGKEDRPVSPTATGDDELNSQIFEDPELVISPGESLSNTVKPVYGDTHSHSHSHQPPTYNDRFAPEGRRHHRIVPDHYIRALANATRKESEAAGNPGGGVVRVPVLTTNTGRTTVRSITSGSKQDVTIMRGKMERSFSFPRSNGTSSAAISAAEMGNGRESVGVFARRHVKTPRRIHGTTSKMESYIAAGSPRPIGIGNMLSTDDHSPQQGPERSPSAAAVATVATALAVEVQEEDIDLSLEADLTDLQRFHTHSYVSHGQRESACAGGTAPSIGGGAMVAVAIPEIVGAWGESKEEEDSSMAPAAEVPEEMGLSLAVCEKTSVISLEDDGTILSKSQKSMDTVSTECGGGNEQWVCGGTATAGVLPVNSGSCGGSGIAGLSLELSIPVQTAVEQSYEFSESGRLEIEGFVLNQDGMKSTPTPTPNRRGKHVHRFHPTFAPTPALVRDYVDVT